jgi:hypothetical protein
VQEQSSNGMFLGFFGALNYWITVVSFLRAMLLWVVGGFAFYFNIVMPSLRKYFHKARHVATNWDLSLASHLFFGFLQYASKVSFLANESFSNIPSDIVKDLRLMLNVDEVSRPSALDFTGKKDP